MARSPRTSGPSSARRWLVRGVQFVLIGAALGFIALAVAVGISVASLPSYEEMMKSPQGQSVVVRAADGTELVTVGPSFGRWLPYQQIPATMVDAMKAVEDRRFDWHPGADPIGIARSVWVNWQAGEKVQGGSTITQQLARNIFLTSRQTYGRKVREIILALAIERKFTKRAIMELYLNRVYFGGGAYGIDAASRKFFGHSATTLSLEESAVIAGLVKAPSRYAPSSDPLRAKSRARIVIATMADSGAITPAAAAAADLDGLRFAVEAAQGDVRYFTDWVLTQLDTLTDEAVEPLEVVTTLVTAHQAAAELAVKTQALPGTQAAIVAMRRDGAVTAMVGGRDYVSSIYNRAVVARRQPGSSWKLFDYLAALENGVTPDDVYVDEPLTMDGWSPKNSDNRFRGQVTVRQAFALSVNTVAVQLAAKVGFDTVAEMARRFGISTPIDRRPAMALGTSDVTLLEMTGAYASVAAGGVEARPWAIQRVTTARGTLLYQREAEAPRVLVPPFVAARMTDLLRAAVETGTGRAAQIGRPLAGKTGTTSSNKDGWFIGFTPDLVAGVWIGRDDARRVPGLAGGRAPARVFGVFMSKALTGTVASELNTEVEDPLAGAVEPDNQAYGISPDGAPLPPEPVPGASDPASDPIGQIIDQTAPPPAKAPRAAAQPPLNEKWLEGVIKESPTK
ncbi:transglycosylase domain-containing protein [Sandaracinobacteroides saxicola]|uniref:PBP1A family penicillin-binding protein n=1 Tax=Sandaracinobacteroides saxicola TaxID=2759707 RepID=A0A7G5IH15_9SPHN|nr:PBP1A family penicillin-binding protein [Sandaracinobacteroides saxicola]QMW22657.1 PBP1A family penicillin-binding protein [Sandaracinobacteroides saxicola]